MDYEWKYFMDGLRGGAAGCRLTEQDINTAAAVSVRMDEKERSWMRNIIRNMMVNYREQGEEENALFEELMKAHGEYCRLLPDGDIYRRRHNAVVYRYMMKTPLHSRAVGVKMGICRETVYEYINKTADDLLLLLCGSPAASDTGKDTERCMKEILESLPLIRMSQGIRSRMKWQERQQSREKHLSTTADVLRCLDVEISLYEEFITGCNGSKDQRRALDTLKAVYLGGGGIPEIMGSYGVSEGTVYADIRKMIQRLAELADFLTGRGRRTGQG